MTRKYENLLRVIVLSLLNPNFVFSDVTNVALYVRKQNMCPLEAADQLGLLKKINMVITA